MILTLIGMSGAGKTFLATRLAAHGFICFHCDAFLAAHLRLVIGPVGSSLADIGQWMGLPIEADFRQREAIYLAAEAAILHEAAARARQSAATRTNCVIDTGGSAIYAGAACFQQLRRLSTIVYLSIPATMHRQLVQEYLAEPGPLIWNGLFDSAPGEPLQDSFLRCYTQLIQHRERLYEHYSDVVLEYDDYRDPNLTIERFLQQVQAAAERARAAERLVRDDFGIQIQ